MRVTLMTGRVLVAMYSFLQEELSLGLQRNSQ
ncbi:hypothetical protein LINGRAHAP2_LOCUS23535 [Linum grandiflorum]